MSVEVRVGSYTLKIEKGNAVAMTKGFLKEGKRHYVTVFTATEESVSLEIVSRILGHASIAITADLYCHVDRTEIHETHRRFSPFTKLLLPQSQ